MLAFHNKTKPRLHSIALLTALLLMIFLFIFSSGINGNLNGQLINKSNDYEYHHTSSDKVIDDGENVNTKMDDANYDDDNTSNNINSSNSVEGVFDAKLVAQKANDDNLNAKRVAMKSKETGKADSKDNSRQIKGASKSYGSSSISINGFVGEVHVINKHAERRNTKTDVITQQDREGDVLKYKQKLIDLRKGDEINQMHENFSLSL
ncbi:hypothetical protein DAMA08_052370 [Martiniozyma asiatica (nom. inval.)]|nr:hypothetical protein DAMA08_052370 [Martiniozyma asiatica]